MIVSDNIESTAQSFVPVLNGSISLLRNEALADAQKYLDSAGTKLEGLVLDALNTAAVGTEFDGTIRLASGQKFPDIVLESGGIGVEVKSTTQNHWVTTGNSVLESTRIPNIEKIFLLFGKLADPIDFMVRPYEECLKEVLVTHYPRYQIDMELPQGQTIFDKVGKSYDEIRSLPEPFAPIADYYTSKLQPGESLWWAGCQSVNEECSPVTVKELSSIDIQSRENIIVKSLVLFPQLFGRSLDKFHNVLMWLLRNGIICGNIRDFYTAGGTWSCRLGCCSYNGLPQIVKRLYVNKSKFLRMLDDIDANELQLSWHQRVSPSTDRLKKWISLASSYAQNSSVSGAIATILS